MALRSSFRRDEITAGGEGKRKRKGGRVNQVMAAERFQSNNPPRAARKEGKKKGGGGGRVSGGRKERREKGLPEIIFSRIESMNVKRRGEEKRGQHSPSNCGFLPEKQKSAIERKRGGGRGQRDPLSLPPIFSENRR